MTNGTSQGLFVIVAVVIFGIFVLISYLLFRDTLKLSLTTIFKDSLEQTENQLSRTDKNKFSLEQVSYTYLSPTNDFIVTNTINEQVGNTFNSNGVVLKNNLKQDGWLKGDILIVNDSDGFDYYIVNGKKVNVEDKTKTSLTIPETIPITMISENLKELNSTIKVSDAKGNLYTINIKISII